MANEELIYLITRAVYERLGANADERIVSDLVADIYRAVGSGDAPDVSRETRDADDASQTSRARVEPAREMSGRTSRAVTAAAAPVGASGVEEQAAQDAASRLIVSVFGVDRPGIVAFVSQVLADAECSIVDINQTVVQGKFAMVLIADMRRARASAAELKDRFRKEGERLGVRIYAQREDIFNAMHRV